MKRTAHSALLPIAFILVASFSVQGGAAIAKGIFPLIGVAGTAAIRIFLSAIMLLAVFRPPVRRLTREQWRAVVPYGISIGVMNLLFYQALARIPLGLAVALEFVGPLALAIFGSRRALDVVWVLLAMAGIVLIAPFKTGGAVDPVGVVYALLTGACWAAYIVLGGRVSQRLDAGAGVAIGMAVAALVAMPFAVAEGGIRGFGPALLIPCIALAVLSSALPFTLEMKALRLLPGRIFSVLMSLEPVVAALCGLVLLGERLTGTQGIAVAAIVIASAGAATSVGQRARASPGSG
ncbi:MAG TPA: DMT family transporter [Vicinamibacterales bacterium]|nr:DMT family transporter [Vicinamibacterales bacterium]